MDIWAFISAPENQKTLSFVGGGIAVVISALWTAYITFRKKPKTPPPPFSGGDGVTAGGDVLIEGGVTVNKTNLPKGAMVLGAVGLAVLAYGAFAVGSAQNGDCIVDSISAGGDITAGDISITGGSGDVDCD